MMPMHTFHSSRPASHSTRSRPASRSTQSKKGQYFSADAIIAAFIFVMALSLLTAHWFALRAQAESQSVSLLDDANRVSDLLLMPGNPPNWYSSPLGLTRSAGFGLNGTRGGTLNQTALMQAQAVIISDINRYTRSRQLMAMPADYYVEINATSLDTTAPPYLPIAIGRAPAQPTDRVQVYRGVLIPVVDNSVTPPHTYYYYGIMTVTLWTNKSNI